MLGCRCGVTGFGNLSRWWRYVEGNERSVADDDAGLWLRCTFGCFGIQKKNLKIWF